MAAARAHRATQTDDVLSSVFSRLALRDGCVSVASVCKQWRDAWRRRAKGLYRPFRLGVGEFDYGDHITAMPGGGVVVPDYNGNGFELFTAQGLHRGSPIGHFSTPTAVALDDEGVSWVVLHDACALVHRLVDYDAMEPGSAPSPKLEFAARRPIDVATSGNAVLVLYHRDWTYGEVTVLDKDTKVVRHRFGSSAPGGVDEMRGAMGLAIDGEYCFVADTYNQSVVVFNWREGTFVRRYGKAGEAPVLDDDEDADNYWDGGPYDDDRKSAAPGEFNEPYDVAIRNKLLYVSERGGRRIQVLRLPDDLSRADPEVLQIIPSPGGVELAGICLDGDRLWCIGPPIPGSEPGARAKLNIFAPIV